MMDDQPSNEPPVPPAEETAAPSQGPADASMSFEAAAEAVQDGADAVRTTVDNGIESTSNSAAETAKAFEEARGRLQSVASIGIDQGRGLLDQFKSGTDVLSSKLGATYARTTEQMVAFNAKAIEAWRTNAEATLAHWQNLAGIKSWSEMISLNAAHTRKQIEAMTTQTRELAELAGQLARDAGDSMKRP